MSFPCHSPWDVGPLMGLTQAIKSIKLKTQEGSCVVMRDQKLLAATAYCNRKSVGTSSVEIWTSECRAFTSETQICGPTRFPRFPQFHHHHRSASSLVCCDVCGVELPVQHFCQAVVEHFPGVFPGSSTLASP